MGELLHSLGIDAKLLFAQALNFGIVLFVLWKFAYKPILKVLDERRERIVRGEADAESAAKSLQDAEKEHELLLADARRVATTILAETRTAAEAVKARAVEEAEQERARILAQAKRDAEAEKSRAMAEAKGEVADLVVMATGKVLGSELTEAHQRQLVKQALREIES
jgi:F-type H+-transporting ATPase subunit b